ncbi:MAG: type II toxin-antitoxin system PemK/MazF family toxin [Microbacterium sp.]
MTRLLRPSASQRDRGASSAGVAENRPGPGGAHSTIEVVPPGRDELEVSYAPSLDGDPDAGEIVWTWVPYDERDGRGKDRPVLVIARADEDSVYAVRLTSKSHDGDRDYLAIGAGEWDPQARPSWVDVEQIYLVHAAGMRREASVLDPVRFRRVTAALQDRYGWNTAG